MHDDFTIVVFENKSFFSLELSKLKNIRTNDQLFISDIDSAEENGILMEILILLFHIQ